MKQLFRILPDLLKTEVIRSSMDVGVVLETSIKFKVADTESEFRQAFHLVHDAYVEEGFMTEQESKMRIIPQHHLESTTVVVAKQGDEVVGTVTIVRDNKIGLPLERVFQIAHLRQGRRKLAEITCLSVKKKFRRAQGGAIFTHLMKFIYKFSASYFGVDEWVVVVHPKDAIFYEGLLCFSALEKKAVDYLGAPAIALSLDLTKAPEAFRKVYDWRPFAKNLYRFFVLDQVANFEFPERVSCEINYPSFELFSDRFSSVSQPADSTNLFYIRSRAAKRFEVACNAYVETLFRAQDNEIKILDVSESGLKAYSNKSLNLGQSYQLNLKINTDKNCLVQAKLLWQDDKGDCGFVVERASNSWQDFIGALMAKHGLGLQRQVS